MGLLALGLNQFSAERRFYKHGATLFDPFTVDALDSQLLTVIAGKDHDMFWTPHEKTTIHVYFSPNNTVTRRILDRVADKLDVTVKGFVTENDLVDEQQKIIIKRDENGKLVPTNLLGAVVFSGDQDSKLPSTVDYKIRMPASGYMYRDPMHTASQWMTELSYENDGLDIGPRGFKDQYGGMPGYYQEGFLALQKAIDESIIRELNPSVDLDQVNIHLQRFPYPAYRIDMIYQFFRSIFTMLMFVSFCPALLCLAEDVVKEKETMIRAYMKMMGLSGALHWTAWFIKYFSILFVTSILMTVILKLEIGGASLCPNTDVSLLLLFFILYAAATITFAFAITAPFSKASRASTVAMLGYSATYFLASYVDSTVDEKGVSSGAYFPMYLLHNMALVQGFESIFVSEQFGLGVRWSTMTAPIGNKDQAFGIVLMVLLIDTFFYSLLAYYLDALFPGKYGVAKHWSFIFKKYKRKRDSDLRKEEGDEAADLAALPAQFFETPPEGARAGVKLRNLRKEFDKDGQTKVAVEGTTMDLYEGQISALLGQNGAGKTTTMHMIVGLTEPTSGYVMVGKHNVLRDLEAVKQSLGICPQFDCVFEQLTVQEHLEFYAKLKGVSANEVKDKIDDLVTSLDLKDAREKLANQLSGGMKRKLSVAMALVGNNKVIILDEPTTGLDPQARKATWDVLKRHREGRTILLTTHSMEEAEALGERIAIMVDGCVKCCGSPMFLKNKYSVGYHLVIVKGVNFNLATTTEVIQHHLPDSKVLTDAGAEVTFTLRKDQSESFEQLFLELENRKVELGITTFGLSVTTLEEVFLKVAMEYSAHGDDKMTEEAEFAETMESPLLGNKENKEVRNNGRQLLALLWKRYLHFRKNLAVTIFSTLAPIIFLIFVFISFHQPKPSSESPELPLTITDVYKSLDTPYVVLDEAGANTLLGGIVNSFKSEVQLLGTEAVNIQDEDTYKSAKNVSGYILDVASEDKSKYEYNLLVAAEFSKLSYGIDIVGFFNNEAIHSPAILLNIIDNAILRHFVSNSSRIGTVNHPFPRSRVEELTDNRAGTLPIDHAMAFYLIIGFALFVGVANLFIIRERTTGTKGLQLVSGVSHIIYWLSHCMWDYARYIVATILVVLCLTIWGAITGAETTLTDSNNRLYLFWLLSNYGWSVIPASYLFSFVFTSPTTGYNWTSIINVVSVIVGFVLSLPLFGGETLPEIFNIIYMIVCPPYALMWALSTMAKDHHGKSLCAQEGEQIDYRSYCKLVEMRNRTHYCCPNTCSGLNCYNPEGELLSFSVSEGILSNLAVLAVTGVVFFCLILLVENPRVRNRTRLRALQSQQQTQQTTTGQQMDMNYLGYSSANENIDVSAERSRLWSIPRGQLKDANCAVLFELSKYYDGLKAVDMITLGVDEGECFGLLGANGAGKTSIFKILTGDQLMSAGDAYMNKHSVLTDMNQIWRGMGYCPQSDAMFDYLTVEQTLSLFARLKGVEGVQRETAVNTLMKTLLIEEYKNKTYKELSGGTKRKLSTAVALIGDPQIILLDEPTTGLDPVSRRRVWTLISKIRETGRTIILTSHSMEECDALCTRITIMVNGQMKCLGPSQALKEKFGQGLILSAKIQCNPGEDLDSKTTAFVSYIHQSFPGSTMQSNVGGLIVYNIPCASTLQIPYAFGTLEKGRATYGIEDYTISQTTLEQVFLNLVKAQLPPSDYKLQPLISWEKISGKLCPCCCGEKRQIRRARERQERSQNIIQTV